MSRIKRVFKTLLISVSILVFLLLVAMIVIPLVVDVDHYRPQIVQAVNERINGKFELGKLKLSLWGQVRVEVAGVRLNDWRGQSIVKVENAFFHLPFTSLLSGSPELTFQMKKPELSVVKDKNGKLNVLTLLKQTAAASATGAIDGSTSGVGTGGGAGSTSKIAPTELPGIVTKARLGVEIREASLSYFDEALGKKPQRVQDLNLIIRDISLSRTMSLELWASLASQLEQASPKDGKNASLQLRGPLKLNAQVKPHLSQGKLDYLQLAFKADFNDVEVLVPGLFEKKKGILAQAQGILKTSFEKASIEQFDVQFHNAAIQVTGEVTQLKSGMESGPQLRVQMKSNEISFQPWSELIPLLKNYDLGGTVFFDADIQGEASKLNYKANLSVQKVTAKAPHLKAQPEINGSIKVITDQVESMHFSFKAPGNDLKVSGKLVSFLTPKMDVQVTSSGMDLDQLIEFPPLQKTKEEKSPTQSTGAITLGEGELGSKGEELSSAATGTGVGAGSHPNKPTTDFDALLDPLRENKMILNTAAHVSIHIDFVKAYGIKIANIASKLFFKNLVAGVESFSMGVFGGRIQAQASVDLKPKAPEYRFSSEVSALDLHEAVKSQFKLFKNTVLGKAFFKMTGTGSGFNPDVAIKNLSAKGSMKIEKATFATVDVGKMAANALNQTLSRLAEKIPQLKGKSLSAVSGRESRYDLISSDFVISGGKFSAPNFVAKAEPKQGIDLKGDTLVGISDFSLKTAWEVIDTHNLTHARDLSVDQAGVTVSHILAEGEKPVRFPVHVNCTLMAPCYSYTEVPEFLGKIALNNVAHAVEGRAKAELKRRAEEEAKKLAEHAPPAVKDQVESIKKKLFGR